jgi:DNA-binding transcriptional LysR family regulator
MNTKYLVTLKTILETGSFQKAAHKLNYTQSTATFHIQQIERELSIKLFEKIGRKMVLTQAGIDVMPHIETILQATAQINDYGKDISEMTGTLQIAMPDALLIYGLQTVLKKFREQAPNVQLIIKSLTCCAIRDEIIRGSVDVGIHCDIGGYPDTVLSEKLTQFYTVLVASSDADSSQLDFISPHQRKTINFITNDPHSVYQKTFDKYLEDRDIVLNSDMEMWSIEATKLSVVGNLGITYLPDYTIDQELKTGLVIPIKTLMDDIAVDVVCSYHKNKWISASMELFIRLLKDSFDKYKKY